MAARKATDSRRSDLSDECAARSSRYSAMLPRQHNFDAFKVAAWLAFRRWKDSGGFTACAQQHRQGRTIFDNLCQSSLYRRGAVYVTPPPPPPRLPETKASMPEKIPLQIGNHRRVY